MNRRQLGVGYVVEGSVRKSGGRVRITAQVNDVATGSDIWAKRHDRGFADAFAVQDEITEAIVAAIEPQLYATESFRAQRKPPDSLDAWDLVMRALSHYWRVTRQDNVVAQALLEKAIAIDPHYGQALGVLAATYTFSFHMAGPTGRRRHGRTNRGRCDSAPRAAPRAAERLARLDRERNADHAGLRTEHYLEAFRRAVLNQQIDLRCQSPIKIDRDRRRL
jgi:hypothetical protein